MDVTENNMLENRIADNKTFVPIWEKYTLTISEAAEYFNLVERKLRYLADSYNDYGFVLLNESRILIKRKKFEEFIDETNVI